MNTFEKFRLFGALTALLLSALQKPSAGQWVVYEGKDGPGQGKHIVMLSGDEEYRSEEGCPCSARSRAERHGLKCTILFSQDPPPESSIP